MNRALVFAGYDVRHIWGTGTHNGNQAASIFPTAMRWLWRDWPVPIRARESANPVSQGNPAAGQRLADRRKQLCARYQSTSNPQALVFYQSGNIREIPQVNPDEPIQCGQMGEPAPFAFRV
jgi:hypothetical protein